MEEVKQEKTIVLSEHLDKLHVLLQTGVKSGKIQASVATLVMNDLSAGIELLMNATEGVMPKIKAETAIQELWQEWELHRLYKGKVYTSDIERTKAFKRCLALVDEKMDKFVELMEYAISWGYTDIYPKILDKMARENQAKAVQLFRDSKFNNITNLLRFFYNFSYFREANFEHYQQRALEWSDARGEKRANWAIEIKKWIEKDIQLKKLERINSEKYSIKETGKLQNIWNSVIEFLRGNFNDDDFNRLFLKSMPVEKFRIELTLGVPSESVMNEIEEKYISILQEALKSIDIYHIKYQIKK